MSYSQHATAAAQPVKLMIDQCIENQFNTLLRRPEDPPRVLSVAGLTPKEVSSAKPHDYRLVDLVKMVVFLQDGMVGLQKIFDYSKHNVEQAQEAGGAWRVSKWTNGMTGELRYTISVGKTDNRSMTFYVVPERERDRGACRPLYCELGHTRSGDQTVMDFVGRAISEQLILEIGALTPSTGDSGSEETSRAPRGRTVHVTEPIDNSEVNGYGNDIGVKEEDGVLVKCETLDDDDEDEW